MSHCSRSEGKRPPFEVADVFRENLDKLEKLSPQQWKVVNAILSCRTSRMGGHVYECNRCGHRINSYNSCRNRHCPKCQALARAKWLEERMAELLPVEYFHVVFTIPDFLNPLALCNKEVVYAILFRAVKETISESASNPKNLGARIGFLAILHTWGQNLLDHPHIHCVVPGGGLSPDGNKWISSPRGFFIHVKILAKLFRGKFLDYLKKAFGDGKLHFYGKHKQLESQASFQRLLDKAYSKEWVVYAKKPFAGPEQVLKYLGNYTHRIAISNHRIVDIEDGKIIFKWKDYRDGGKRKLMSLQVAEFMRRFLLHVIPKGFVRIRSYGFLSNRNKRKLLATCRELLLDSAEEGKKDEQESGPWQQIIHSLTSEDPLLCPHCRQG
ncbi:MAG: IS91 family transposase, partial [Candidatus Hodarchaeales archaeon]